MTSGALRNLKLCLSSKHFGAEGVSGSGGVEDIRLENWANAYFLGVRYSEMCSTLAECFNAWITNERFLPITPMLFGIMEKMMEMSWNKLEESMK
ncbi:hypothetical protein IFM89_032007 [Coptis chinensis]|uniref:Uncharacterized protein n=1 Tax=Coptis chinensis TaxID=261450 RepID=A0A835LFS3_9MAGN|nr:hypothetical protein IFM89_032007 [Coptis chinensis]